MTHKHDRRRKDRKDGCDHVKVVARETGEKLFCDGLHNLVDFSATALRASESKATRQRRGPACTGDDDDDGDSARTHSESDEANSDVETRSTDGSDNGSDLESFIVDDESTSVYEGDELSTTASLVTESTMRTEDMPTPLSCNKKRKVRRPQRYTVSQFSDGDHDDDDDDDDEVEGDDDDK